MASPPPDSGALALYSEKNAAYAALSTEQRIALLQESRVAAETEEERLKRQEEAEALEAKLRHIIEEVPDREYNLKGSMAGANSMTFDRYRSAKRREELRVAAMEEAERKKEAKRKFEEEVGGKNAAEAKKTEKRRAKREKEKARRKTKQRGAAGEPANKEQGKGKDEDEVPVQQPDLD